MASVRCWCVSLQGKCFGTLRFSKMQSRVITKWYLVIFFTFFWFFARLLIFLRCKDNFGCLGLMLVCFTMSGGLDDFFRARYHIFPPITMRVNSCCHTFMGPLYSFQLTTISSMLNRSLHSLLYIFSEINTYFYDFQRVTTRYHQIFKKRKTLKFYDKAW